MLPDEGFLVREKPERPRKVPEMKALLPMFAACLAEPEIAREVHRSRVFFLQEGPLEGPGISRYSIIEFRVIRILKA